MSPAENVFAFDESEAAEQAETFRTPEMRALDESIELRRDLLTKVLFTVFGSALSNTEKLDVLHELTNPEDRKDARRAADRLAALADRWRHEDKVLGPGRFYLLGADLYAGLADRLAGIRSGAIRDETPETEAAAVEVPAEEYLAEQPH